MSKKMYWIYDMDRNCHELYFNVFNQDELVASIIDINIGWEVCCKIAYYDYSSFAKTLDEAKEETIKIIEKHVKDRLNYYNEMLSNLKEDTENDG